MSNLLISVGWLAATLLLTLAAWQNRKESQRLAREWSRLAAEWAKLDKARAEAKDAESKDNPK